MMLDYYVERDGNMVHATRAEWQEWFGGVETNSPLARTVIANVTVSTWAVGIASNFRDAIPFLYATVVFDGKQHTDRGATYATREEALKGHEEIVARVRKVE